MGTLGIATRRQNWKNRRRRCRINWKSWNRNMIYSNLSLSVCKDSSKLLWTTIKGYLSLISSPGLELIEIWGPITIAIMITAIRKTLLTQVTSLSLLVKNDTKNILLFLSRMYIIIWISILESTWSRKMQFFSKLLYFLIQLFDAYFLVIFLFSFSPNTITHIQIWIRTVVFNVAAVRGAPA